MHLQLGHACNVLNATAVVRGCEIRPTECIHCSAVLYAESTASHLLTPNGEAGGQSPAGTLLRRWSPEATATRDGDRTPSASGVDKAAATELSKLTCTGRRVIADRAAAAPPAVTWSLVDVTCWEGGELPRTCPHTRVVRPMIRLLSQCWSCSVMLLLLLLPTVVVLHRCYCGAVGVLLSWLLVRRPVGASGTACAGGARAPRVGYSVSVSIILTYMYWAISAA